MSNRRLRYSRHDLLCIRTSELVNAVTLSKEECGLAYVDGARERWDERMPLDGSYNSGIDEILLLGNESISGTTFRTATNQTLDSKAPIPRRDFSALSRRSASPQPADEELGRNLVPVDSAWLKSHPLIDGSLEEELEPARKDVRGAFWQSSSPPAPSPPPGFSTSPRIYGTSPPEKKRIFQNRSPEIFGKDSGNAPSTGFSNVRYARGPAPSQNFYRRKHPELFRHEKRPIAPLALPSTRQEFNGKWRSLQGEIQEDLLTRSAAGVTLPELAGIEDDAGEKISSSDADPLQAELRFNPSADMNFQQFAWLSSPQPESSGEIQDLLSQGILETGGQSSRAFGRWFGEPQLNDERRGGDFAASGSQVIENEELSPSVLSFFNTVKEQAMIGAPSENVPGQLQESVDPEGNGQEFGLHQQGAIGHLGVATRELPLEDHLMYEHQILESQMRKVGPDHKHRSTKLSQHNEMQYVQQYPQQYSQHSQEPPVYDERVPEQGMAVAVEDFFRAANLPGAMLMPDSAGEQPPPLGFQSQPQAPSALPGAAMTNFEDPAIQTAIPSTSTAYNPHVEMLLQASYNESHMVSAGVPAGSMNGYPVMSENVSEIPREEIGQNELQEQTQSEGLERWFKDLSVAGVRQPGK